MALMSVKDAVAKVNPQYAANIEAMYRHARDNDLRAAEVITDVEGYRVGEALEVDLIVQLHRAQTMLDVEQPGSSAPLTSRPWVTPP